MIASFLFAVLSVVVFLVLGLDRFLLAGAPSSLPKWTRSRGNTAASGKGKGPRRDGEKGNDDGEY